MHLKRYILFAEDVDYFSWELNMFRFIHTADIHLDSPLRGLEAHEDAPVEEIRGATRKAFDNLVELAIEERVQFVLIAGDLYDGDWKDYNTGLFFVERMARLGKAGIRVLLVSGNHDAASQITRVMPLPDNVTLLSGKKPQSVKLDEYGVIVHGQSYQSRSEFTNIAAGYPAAVSGSFNIGLLHTALTGREGHEPYAPCSLDDLRSKGYDYWALGHVHSREVVAQDPMMLFPGNIQGRHIKETGARGATLVTVDDHIITAVEEHELDVVRWSVCRIDLSVCEGSDELYDAVRTAMAREQGRADGRVCVLRLQLEGSTSIHAELHSRPAQWLEEFRGIAVGLGDIWLEKVVLKTRRKRNLEEIVGADTPQAELLQRIEKLDFGSAELYTQVPEIASLRSKLPVELLDEDSLLGASVTDVDALRQEVKELLIAKLILHGEES
jgi:exonuclease SbcD